jgi:hypothetical protein
MYSDKIMPQSVHNYKVQNTLPLLLQFLASVTRRHLNAVVKTGSIKQIVFLDFIHHLVSQEQTKLKKLKIIDKRLKPK